MEILISQYLSQNKYESSYFDEFKENYLSHPDYPSLYAVTDSLELSGIETVTATVPKEQLQNLPDIFIASLVIENKTEFVLVNKDQTKITYENQKGKTTKISFDEFKNIWDGLVLAVEENEIKEKPKSSVSENKKIWFAVPLVLLLFGGLLNQINSEVFLWNYTAFLFLSIIGLLLGIFIIQESLGEANPVVSKVCNGSSKTVSCDSVVKSNESKLLFGISFSDLPIVFFLTNLFLIATKPAFFEPIGFFCLLSVPVILYSVYLQKFKIKKWCILCLGVSAVLLLQTAVFLFSYKQMAWNIYDYLQYIIAVTVIWFIWKVVEKVLINRNDLISKNRALFRFKRNFEVFDFLSGKNVVSENIESLKGIIIGKKDNPVKLRLFLSPGCGHCHTAYRKGLELIESYPDKISLEVLFNINIQNTENPFIPVVERLYEVFLSENANVVEAFEDWHIKNMSLEDWLKKWKQTEISETTKTEIQKQYAFCIENNLNYTPVIIVNNVIYPKEYDLEDLKYFISDLEEKQNPFLV